MKTFLALYVGAPGSGPPDMSPDALQAGMQAWTDWGRRWSQSVVVEGGPVGVTKSVSAKGVADIRNGVGGFIVVQAESHEAAAEMFLNHPHFTNFPGEAVEVMEILPIPAMP